MASDPAQTARRPSCPTCGAGLRPGSPWCTLCYTDLRPPAQTPAAAAPTSAPPTASYGPAAGDPLTQPLLDFLPSVAPSKEAPSPQAAASRGTAAAGWPCTGCGSTNDLEAASCASCGKPFLAEVAAARPSLVLPLVGDLARMTRAQRLLTATGAVLVLLLLVVLVSLLL